MGHSLGLTIIAEGIETREQEAYLREAGCEIGQGFYYARPALLGALH
ncbi:EAL domain-containing protein [Halorhodospira halochloris]|nr:EAL domain-containing protein [Halorhodospira halochloris]MCG5548489.1 EAL domain-containing protein [Halorhodospira halochloris]